MSMYSVRLIKIKFGGYDIYTYLCRMENIKVKDLKRGYGVNHKQHGYIWYRAVILHANKNVVFYIFLFRNDKIHSPDNMPGLNQTVLMRRRAIIPIK